MSRGAPTRSVDGRARRLGRDARRAAIVADASGAFAERGYATTSMADIARATGVSHLIVYRHFASKQELYDAVLERAAALLADALAADGAIGNLGPTPAAMLAAARADVPGFRVLWRHAPREPEFSRHTNAARRRCARATRGALEPLVAAEHLDWAVRATVAYLIEAVLVWVEDGDPRLDARFVAATTAALRAGVKSWAGPS